MALYFIFWNVLPHLSFDEKNKVKKNYLQLKNIHNIYNNNEKLFTKCSKKYVLKAPFEALAQDLSGRLFHKLGVHSLNALSP